MACFTVPLATAAVASAVKTTLPKSAEVNPFVGRLGWLGKMMFGGSFLLAIEHVWHGEITWRYPFLTAVKDGETAGMLREIATIGVSMAVLITAVWAGMVLVASALERRRAPAARG